MLTYGGSIGLSHGGRRQVLRAGRRYLAPLPAIQVAALPPAPPIGSRPWLCKSPLASHIDQDVEVPAPAIRAPLGRQRLPESGGADHQQINIGVRSIARHLGSDQPDLVRSSGGGAGEHRP